MALLTTNFTGVTLFFILAEFIMLAVISLGVALIIGFSTSKRLNASVYEVKIVLNLFLSKYKFFSMRFQIIS